MQIFAHRGASAYAPENTMSAFRLAHSMQADGIELDVQQTRDGAIVICHDHSINRTSNGKGWLHEYSLSDLKEFDFGSWFHTDFRGEQISTLDEFLTWFVPTGMLLNIEIKNGPIIYPGIEQKIIQTVEKFDLVDRVFISSFHHHSLRAVKSYYPELKTGALFVCRSINPIEFCHQTHADYLHPAWNAIDKEWATEAKRQGIRIHTFTINERSQYDFVDRMGVDAIFTDYPDIWRKGQCRAEGSL